MNESVTFPSPAREALEKFPAVFQSHADSTGLLGQHGHQAVSISLVSILIITMASYYPLPWIGWPRLLVEHAAMALSTSGQHIFSSMHSFH